ncbi:MAG: penicillin acylase family protein, partial [Rhizobacter sp.]|nr:penicillin acylase family protein [Chlorobiales bacterium]
MSSRTKKIIIGLSVSVLVLLAVAALFLYRILHKSIPDYAARFDALGVAAPVNIYYDPFAVAHIDAASEPDLYFAQGFAHARERLWQMDFQRRAAAGRLAEILGEDAIGFDRLFRTVGLRRMADSLWLPLSQGGVSDETRAALIAYTNGVNEYLRQVKEKNAALPTEFDLLQYEPEAWTPEDCLATVRLIGWELNIAWHTDIALAELMLKLGAEKAMQVYPDYPKGKPLIISEPERFTNTSRKKSEAVAVLKTFRALDTDFRTVFGTAASHLGSNSWAVTKSKSSTGKAIFANDPHLGFLAPARWYEVQLTCSAAGINAAGASLPGVPGIVLGKNDSLAWGLTNVMADDCDFFLVDSLQKNFFTEIDEEIKVKGKDLVRMVVKVSPAGVVIDDVVRGGMTKLSSPLLQSRTVAMKWTGHEKSDEVRAFLGLLKAKNWTAFRESVRHFAVPGQNFLYADAAGNIGYQAGAKLPLRNDKQGFLLRDARLPSQAWQGFVPYDSLPSVFNPPSDMIVAANNKTISDAYPYYISSLWEPPARAERITELLNAKQKNSPQDFERMQSDVVSPHARDLTPYLLNALAGDTLTVHQKPIAYLRNWQFEFDKNSIAATIYSQTFARLLRNTFADEMGEDTFESYLTLVNMPTRVINKLVADSTVITSPPDSLGQIITTVTDNLWFDDITTGGRETRDDVIRKSFSEAVSILRNELG